jgi:hypothetical protein
MNKECRKLARTLSKQDQDLDILDNFLVSVGQTVFEHATNSATGMDAAAEKLCEKIEGERSKIYELKRSLAIQFLKKYTA